MKFFQLLIISIAFCSCNNKSNSNVNEQLVEIPEDFVTFYEKFHSDSVFQMDHIIFPLSMKNDSSKWQKSEWVLHKAFNSQNGAYTREFDNFNGIIIENIREKNNVLNMERRFSKFGDDYSLIFYSITNQLENWGDKILTDSLNTHLIDD